MKIEVDKTSFEPNEMIEGKVALTLNKPIKAKGVFISLSSKETRRTTRNGKLTIEHYTHYWVTKPLDQETEYPANQTLEYPFKMNAPAVPQPSNLIGTAIKFIRQDKSSPPIKYKNFKIEARLDISHGLDVNCDHDISIQYYNEEKPGYTYSLSQTRFSLT